MATITATSFSLKVAELQSQIRRKHSHMYFDLVLGLIFIVLGCISFALAILITVTNQNAVPLAWSLFVTISAILLFKSLLKSVDKSWDKAVELEDELATLISEQEKAEKPSVRKTPRSWNA